MRVVQVVIHHNNDILGQHKVLRTIAEDIKIPLLRITAETQLTAYGHSVNPTSIESTIDAVLGLLDSYIVSTQLYSGQQELVLEPVSVGAIVNDAAHYLEGFAKQFDCSLTIEAPQRHKLAMAHPLTLRHALTSLGYSMINALSNGAHNTMTFIVRQKSDHVQVGILQDECHITVDELKKSRQNIGTARQVMSRYSHTSSAGIVVADSLFNAMNSSLRIIHRKTQQGLAANLVSSKQLALL